VTDDASVRCFSCSTSAQMLYAHRSCAWRKISDDPAMSFLRWTYAHQRAFWSNVSEHLHSCVRRIRTATSFCDFLNWTSWLQPWEGSV
jgi:hypothetical protein